MLIGLAFAPILIILVLLLIFKKSADFSGIVGWLVVSVIACIAFHTSLEILARSTVAGFIRSFPVSLIVATSLFQMAFLEKTGALHRITLFLRTISSSDRAVQIMIVNIGFGTLMVSVGATPVSFMPPILLAMGYTTYAAIMLPSIGYDSLCTYALLGAPIVVFVDLANKVLNLATPITLSQAGSVFFMFLPVVSTLIGFSMLWIANRWKGIKQGWLPCLLSGLIIGLVSSITNRFDNLVVLTGVFCGVAVILVMMLYLNLTGKPVFNKSILSEQELAYTKSFPLAKAFLPWVLLILLIVVLNVPKGMFHLLYDQLRLPITGVAPDSKPIDTRFLWNSYTWIAVSTVLAIPFFRPTHAQWKDIFTTWCKRAPRPVFSAAIFFAIGEIMNMSGFDSAVHKFVHPSMVTVMAASAAHWFDNAYGSVVSFLGLLGGFVTGSETSSIAMFGRFSLLTSVKLHMNVTETLLTSAALAFGAGLASVISPAKLQNAAASIDKLGQEGQVMRLAFVLSLLLTLVTSVLATIMLTL